MSELIYADNAATTALAPEALEAMMPYLTSEYANASQLYPFSRKARKAVENARAQIAACIGAAPEEILFTSCGTESNNWVLKSIALHPQKPQNVVTSCMEHHAILNTCKRIEQYGRLVRYLSVSKQAVVDAQELERTLNSDIEFGLVSLMFANNEVGSIQPIQELCTIVHRHHAFFHTDAVQAVGHLPLDVHELGVDFLSASAHKFNGPKGIGFLYKKREIELSPHLDGGSQEYGMRAGTENVAAIVGMAKALALNCARMKRVTEHLAFLEDLLLSLLREKRVHYVRNGASVHTPGNISLSFPGAEGEVLLHRLALNGICVSTGSACDSKRTQLSHVLQAMNMSEEQALGTIRISLGAHNTEEEVRILASTLHHILR